MLIKSNDTQLSGVVNCNFCFMELERGEQVTYLPCVVTNRSKSLLKKKRKGSIFDTSRSSHTNSSHYSKRAKLLGLPEGGSRKSVSSTNSATTSFDKCHVFHFDCLKEWLNDNDRCPVCNLVIDENLTAEET